MRPLLFVLALLSALLADAAPSGPRWHEVKELALGFRLEVPVFAPKLEEALRITRDRSTLPAEGEAQVRIQNYSDDELSPGEVPSLRPGQFWIEVVAARRPALSEAELTAHCVGPVTRLPRGGWCAYDPARLEGEGSMTHIGWITEGKRAYRVQINARGLEPGMAGVILGSLRAI
jgi:hypothetical protein